MTGSNAIADNVEKAGLSYSDAVHEGWVAYIKEAYPDAAAIIGQVVGDYRGRSDYCVRRGYARAISHETFKYVL